MLEFNAENGREKRTIPKVQEEGEKVAIHPQIIFNGNCKEVLSYYEGVSGVTEVSVIHYGDNP